MNAQEIKRKVILAYHSMPRYILAKMYGCGPFHITPLRYKNYCNDIINHINSRPQRDSILDYGCGLGDVLLAADYKLRIGIDHKSNVLKALKLRALLSRQSRFLETRCQRFGENIEGAYDCIVICNWIHNIPPKELQTELEKMFKFNLNPGGEIIFDVLTGPTYPYHHDADYLAQNLKARVSQLGSYTSGHISASGQRRTISMEKPI